MSPVALIARGCAIAYYGSLRACGLTAARRRLRDPGAILCYHNVVPDNGPRTGNAGLHMERNRFERQMRWLVAHHDILPLRLFVRRLHAGVSLRGSVAITFDDAYEGVFREAVPVLRALRIPATVFVVTDAPGGGSRFWWDHPAVQTVADARRQHWLRTLRGDGPAILSEIGAPDRPVLPKTHGPADWMTIRVHAHDGIDLGVHSATHRVLTTLSDAELRHELVDSRAALHVATGVWAELLAYPYGHCDDRVAAYARAAGYQAAFGLSANGGATADPWRLARMNVPSGISDGAFEAWTAGFRGRCD